MSSSAPLTAASGEQFKPGRLLSTPAVRATAPPSVSLGAMCLHELCAVQNLDANRSAVSEVGSSPMGPCGALPAAVQMRASH